MTTKIHTYDYEYTDTFGGEANYSWVHRGTVQASNISLAARRARKELGLSGHRGTIQYSNSDECHWKPAGMCTILFVTYHEGQS